jgi:hypothetical protein
MRYQPEFEADFTSGCCSVKNEAWQDQASVLASGGETQRLTDGDTGC